MVPLLSTAGRYVRRKGTDVSDGNDSTNNPQRPQDTGALEHIYTIYSQNAQGPWKIARDRDGNTLINQPRDTTKLEKLIDKMREDNIRAWMIQETWEEEDEIDIEIRGYHVFRHKKNRREWKGSPL